MQNAETDLHIDFDEYLAADAGLLKLRFDVPPKEAIEYFKAKKILSSKDFQALEAEARSAAFTVGSIYKDDILQAFKDEIENALTNGASQQTVIKRFKSILSGAGHRELGDFHLETVFRTNMQMAYGVGRRRQMEEVSDLLPFWEYSAVADDRTRPTHRSLDGVVLPVDNPFWNEHFPPWGFNCRCTVIATLEPPANYNPEKPNAETTLAYDADGVPVKAERGTSVYDLSAGKFVGVPRQTALAPTIKQAAKRAKPFPDDLNDLEEVRPLGGTTGAKLMRDKQTGKQFVMKRGANPEHLLEETYADAAYQSLGVKVPKFKVFQDANNNPVKIAQFIEGESLGDVINSGDLKRIAKIKAQLQKDFAADALLGNWDVIGLNYDNILVDKKGTAWRIDNGGSLRFRAQGSKKAKFDEHTTDLWTLRGKTLPSEPFNAQTAEIFEDLDFYALAKQITAYAKKEKKLLNALPKDLKPVIKDRLATLRDIAEYADDFAVDKWKSGYADDVLRHVVGLRESGIIARLPQRLEQMYSGAVEVQDENGKKWDSLRGSNSIVGDLEKYMKLVDGDLGIVRFWQQQQAGDSWNDAPQAFKHFVMEQTEYQESEFWWKNGANAAQNSYNKAAAKVGAEKYRRSHAAYKAMMLEFLKRVDFKNNNRKRKLVTLLRTEDKGVMQANNLRKGQKGVTIKRGAAESFSIFNSVKIHGSEKTLQNLPHTRIHGIYFFSKRDNDSYGSFLGDSENEFVALPVATVFDYL
jgi:SPP1 gp7 family putative phage head morphogenesis protein